MESLLTAAVLGLVGGIIGGFIVWLVMDRLL